MAVLKSKQILSLQAMIWNYKNIEVYYKDEGKGKVLLLLHGFLENSTMWDSLKPELLKTCRVISVDLLGHGQTGCLGYVHPMGMMAETVAAVLKTLNIKRFSVIGHSMGGYVALALAEQQPNAIDSICLMNSTFEADDEARKTIRKRSIDLAQGNYEALVRMSYVNLFSSESAKNHPNEIEAGLNQALKTSKQGYVAAQEGMCLRSDKLEVLKNLKAKKWMLMGAKDPVIKADPLKNRIRQTDIVLKELECGHMMHIESITELTYLLKHFIE